MKWKRPLAIFGIVLILAMYVIAIVSAFSQSPDSKNWLMAALVSTVIVPVTIYALQMVYHLVKHDDDAGNSSDKDGR